MESVSKAYSKSNTKLSNSLAADGSIPFASTNKSSNLLQNTTVTDEKSIPVLIEKFGKWITELQKSLKYNIFMTMMTTVNKTPVDLKFIYIAIVPFQHRYWGLEH